MSIKTIDPATGATLQTYPEMNMDEVNDIIQLTQSAYQHWRDTDFSTRAKYLNQTAQILCEKKANFAQIMAQEMGKPITAGIAEIEKCALVCDYYAKHGAEFLKEKHIDTEMQKSYVSYQPLGIILAIMPWNFPFWQVFRFAAPNLMAGNGALLKHAAISTGTALEIENLLFEAGFPENLFRSLIVRGANTEAVIKHPLVKAVTLTGSEQAGSQVGIAAGSSLKKVVLELGGSDPYLVLDDADLDLACDAIVKSRMNNTGQVCIAAKRIIASSKILNTLSEKITIKLKIFNMGNPLDENTNFGPMARVDLRDEVHQQVQKSVEKGATLLVGGEIPQGPGAFYPPTVLSNVKKGMPAYDEEIFGPVICLIEAKNEKEAITIANDSPYGLGAAVFTQDIARGETIAAKEIEAGSCFVNQLVASDPRLPFGGIKRSGYGRELSSEGIHEFVNIKTIVVK